MAQELSTEDLIQGKSKSQVKREMLALQQLGERLTRLQNHVLRKLDLPDPLRAAVQEYTRLRSHGAKRRQLQYIGALMRQVDAAVIEEQLLALERGHQIRDKQIRAWYDQLLAADNSGLSEFFDRFPQLDRQQLRRLLRQAHQEIQQQSGTVAGEALFQFLRSELPPAVANAGETPDL